MIFSWLLRVFPAEMRQGWRLVRRDLVLWIALFVLLAVASMAVPPEPRTALSLPLLIGVATAMITALLPAALFDAAARGREIGWGLVVDLLARRAPPLLAYSTLAVVISFGAAGLVRVIGAGILGNSPQLTMISVAAATLVLVILLVRFCFLPFLVILHTRDDMPSFGGGVADHPLVRLVAWPLLASNLMSAGSRWSLTPYVVLGWMWPFVANAVPVSLLLPFTVAWQMLVLTAQAVLFDYFLSKREQFGVKVRPPAEPPQSP